MLLDYVATYPDAIIRYHASDMVLHVDSDAAYIVLPNARSRYAGHFFLGDTPPPPPTKPSSAFSTDRIKYFWGDRCGRYSTDLAALKSIVPIWHRHHSNGYTLATCCH